MQKLLNTLYITSEDAFLALDGGNISVSIGGQKKMIPLHTLESIVSFSYKGATPALMGECVKDGIQLSFFTPFGRFLACASGTTDGNVFLRRQQYRYADSEEHALRLAKTFIYGKLYNSRYLLLKFGRNYSMRVSQLDFQDGSDRLKELLSEVKSAKTCAELRGIEGTAANVYFGLFDQMILQNKSAFHFQGRNRRPPTDRVNALLSFAYSLLANDCSAALQGVGLDPYVGYLHTDRPGRRSLGLDLMEEFRSVYADRFVLTLINNRILGASDFDEQESGAVILNDDARRRFLQEWQKKKRETITHPFLKEKMEWGLAPHIQAMLLARCIRGDLDDYPPFFWK
ncbi:MAG: type I-C CRISPR-associated endonuclease Cas1c [Eubacterium sp.]|jgi:CRISPR-associated protein Cas1|nr:type I-C CRISPR-associated endonuclease Cas1c [Eubacterium sp.]